MELDTIYNEDCLEGMKRIPDGSVDAIICDLPYGTMKTAWKGLDEYDGRHQWDDIIPTDKLFAEYERIVRRGGTIVLSWATEKDEKEGTETPAGGDDNGGEENGGGGNPGELEG